MPRGDGTGPRGSGAMSGRGAGYCAGYAAPGYVSAGSGMAYGMRGGRGRRNMFYATGLPRWARYGDYDVPYASPAPFAEPGPVVGKQALQRRADALQSELDSLKARLASLEADQADE